MSRAVSALRAFLRIANTIPGLTAGANSLRPSGPVVAAYLFAALMCISAAAAEPQLRLVEQDKAPAAFEAVGLPDDHLARLAKLPADDEAWARTLSVYVGKTNQAGQPAI